MVCRWLRSGAEEAQADPTNSVSLADGDWNLKATGSSSYRLDANRGAVEASHSADNDRKLLRALESYIEIKSEEASHYCRATEFLCNLDRTYACFLAWLCTSCNVSSTVAGDPTALPNQGRTDHAPIVCAMSMRMPSKNTTGAIHNAVCRDPRFRQLHDAYCRQDFLDELDCSERWRLHKEIISECALRCWNEMLQESELSSTFASMTLASLARIVLYNKSNTASLVIRRSQLAAKRIAVKDGKVFFLDPAAFEHEYALHRTRLSQDLLLLMSFSYMRPRDP